MPILPNFHLPKEKRAVSGMTKVNVQSNPGPLSPTSSCRKISKHPYTVYEVLISSLVPCCERGRQRGCECHWRRWRRRRRLRRHRRTAARVVALLCRRNRLLRVGPRRQLVFPRLFQFKLCRLGRSEVAPRRVQ